MGNTTKANVLLIAPQLSSVTDEAFNLILADVAEEVSSAGFGAKQEQAQRWLAAHYLTMIFGADGTGASSGTGAIKKEKVGEVETEYSTETLSRIKGLTRYDETGYGRQFESIKKKSIVPFKVIAP